MFQAGSTSNTSPVHGLPSGRVPRQEVRLARRKRLRQDATSDWPLGFSQATPLLHALLECLPLA